MALWFDLCKYAHCVILQSLRSAVLDGDFIYYLFAAEEIYLNSRTFLWPHELEQVLELSGARLNVVRENLEVALK